jgi:hypothetical protein
VESSRFESLTLLAAIIGAAVLGSGSLAIGFGAAAVGDIAILLALFAFDGAAARSGSQSIAFAGVSAYCCISPLFFLANTVLGVALPSSVVPPTGSPWLIFGVWIVVALILFAVDRFRMSARDNVSLASSGLAGAGAGPIITNAPPPSYRPAPIRVEPVAPPQPSYQAPAYQPPAYQQPAYQPPAYTPPPAYAPPAYASASPAPEMQRTVVTDPAADFTAASATAAAPAVQPAPVPPAPQAAPMPPMPDVTVIPPGREALIYLNLVGEGLNVLRTVRAENLGRDYYRIADIMPEGEQWEFTPGQVVKCRKKALSNGKHMVAYEEAPRA